MIEQFIADVARTTGLGVDATRNVTGRLLTMAEAALGPDRMAAIVDPIPGARAAMRAAGDSRYALSETAGNVGAAQTGRFGAEAGLAWIADQTGLGQDRVALVAHELVEFVRRTVGAEAAGALREGLPRADDGGAGPRLDHGAW